MGQTLIYEASRSTPKSDWSCRGCQGLSQSAKVLCKALRMAEPTGPSASLEKCSKEGLPQPRGQCPPILKSAAWGLPGQHTQNVTGVLRGAEGWTRGWKARLPPPPVSHLLPPPFNLQLAWHVGGTRPCSVQSEKLVRCLLRFQNTWEGQVLQKRLRQG